MPLNIDFSVSIFLLQMLMKHSENGLLLIPPSFLVGRSIPLKLVSVSTPVQLPTIIFFFKYKASNTKWIKKKRLNLMAVMRANSNMLFLSIFFGFNATYWM